LSEIGRKPQLRSKRMPAQMREIFEGHSFGFSFQMCHGC
jgi:hypothetical protein